MTENAVPERIAIVHDEFYAKHVGKTRDGRQFFLTTPFRWGGPDFIALYLFDADGNFLEARIDDLGSRNDPTLPGNVKRLDSHE